MRSPCFTMCASHQNVVEHAKKKSQPSCAIQKLEREDMSGVRFVFIR